MQKLVPRNQKTLKQLLSFQHHLQKKIRIQIMHLQFHSQLKLIQNLLELKIEEIAQKIYFEY